LLTIGDNPEARGNGGNDDGDDDDSGNDDDDDGNGGDDNGDDGNGGALWARMEESDCSPSAAEAASGESNPPSTKTAPASNPAPQRAQFRNNFAVIEKVAFSLSS
jgi:hypothetical protein